MNTYHPPTCLFCLPPTPPKPPLTSFLPPPPALPPRQHAWYIVSAAGGAVLTVRNGQQRGQAEGEVGCESAGNWEAQRWRVEGSDSDSDSDGRGQRRVEIRNVGSGGWLGFLGQGGRVGVVGERVEWEVGWGEGVGVPGAAWWVCFLFLFLFALVGLGFWRGEGC